MPQLTQQPKDCYRTNIGNNAYVIQRICSGHNKRFNVLAEEKEIAVPTSIPDPTLAKLARGYSWMDLPGTSKDKKNQNPHF